jgi:DNA-binding CsgD family transcriptional regulator
MNESTMAETEAVMAVVRAEYEAFWMRDHEAHAHCHLHAPDTWFWSYWPHGGIAVRHGWDEIRERTAQAMATFVAASPSYAFEVGWENVVVRIDGNTAWVTCNQRYPSSGGPFSDRRGPGSLTHNLRILERHQGTWKIVLFSVLVPVDQSDGAMLRLDAGGKIIWKSEGADGALEEDLDLVVRAGCLRIRSRSADQKLQSAIRWASSADTRLMALRGSIPIVMDAGEGLPTKLWWLIADSGMMLFSFGNRHLTEDRLAIAASVFGLSPAQLRVATKIVEGVSLVEIAESTRVSVNTVRTQLRRMFEKVGVHSQPALVRVLLSVAAPR